MTTDIKSISYKRKWVEDILSCEKPKGILKLIKQDAKFRHGAGFYVTNIYSIKGDKDWAYFNAYEFSTDPNGKALFATIDDAFSDQWYKFKRS